VQAPQGAFGASPPGGAHRHAGSGATPRGFEPASGGRGGRGGASQPHGGAGGGAAGGAAALGDSADTALCLDFDTEDPLSFFVARALPAAHSARVVHTRAHAAKQHPQR
jgi:hypothetical protein